MNEKEKSFIRQVFESITSPMRSFDSIQTEDFTKSFTIIIIIAIISALAGFTYASKIPTAMLEGASQRRGFGPQVTYIDPQTVRSNLMNLRALQNVLKTFIGWIFLAILCHTIATVMVGRGSFRRMLTLLGFAHIPFLFQQVARVIDASIISEEVLATLISNNPFGKGFGPMLLTNFIADFNVFGIWSFVLSVVAVSKNYNSMYRKTFTIVLLSYVLTILFRSFLPL